MLTELQDTTARALRARALALLEEACAIDGLQPYLVSHSHGWGATNYLLWCRDAPGEHEAERVLASAYEPELDEGLAIDDGLALEALTGVSITSRLDDICAAEIEGARAVDAAAVAARQPVQAEVETG